MTHLKLITVLCLVLGAGTAMAAGDYYVWVDENGVTNYSERNPKGYNAQHVTDSTAPGFPEDSVDNRRPGRPPAPQAPEAQASEAPAATAPTSAPGQDVDPDELAAQQRAAFEQEIAETRSKNCELGKRNLAQLQAYARIRVEGEDGNERMLTDEEKQARIDEARQIIRENCTG